MQAVPLSSRKATGGSPDGIAPFLQLPHINETVIKKVARKVSQNIIYSLLSPKCKCINFPGLDVHVCAVTCSYNLQVLRSLALSP